MQIHQLSKDRELKGYVAMFEYQGWVKGGMRPDHSYTSDWVGFNFHIAV